MEMVYTRPGPRRPGWKKLHEKVASLLHCLSHNLIIALRGILYDQLTDWGKAQSQFMDVCTKCRHQLEVEGCYITAQFRSVCGLHWWRPIPLWEVLLVDLVVHLELKKKRIEVSILITIFMINRLVGWSGVWIEQDKKICGKKVWEGSLGMNTEFEDSHGFLCK